MDATTRHSSFRSPVPYYQIGEAVRIIKFCKDYSSFLYTKPSNDIGLNDAMRELNDSNSSDTDRLLLLSNSLLDCTISTNPRWINVEADLLPISINLHLRHAELSEQKGRFSAAAREFWAAGDNASVVRVYWKWVKSDREKGNLLDAARLEQQLKRGEHPLSAPIFKNTISGAAKRNPLLYAKRQG